MSKANKIIAAICCFAFSTALSYAEPKGHDGPMHDKQMSGGHIPGGKTHEKMGDGHFKEMDVNGDGMVSKAEFDDAHARHFKEMDANGDGKLSIDEMRAGHAQGRKPHGHGEGPAH